MNALATSIDSQKAFGVSPRSLEVQLMYEDTERGLRAKGALDCVLARLKTPVEFSVNLWRFDLLQDPALSHLAAIASAEPDLVVLSARSCEVLPMSVRSWLEGWFTRSCGEPRALVISLDADVEAALSASPTLAALRARAALSGVELLLHYSGAERLERGSAVTIGGARLRARGDGVLGLEVASRV